MLKNNKGSTLIESLFAFEIYITVLILFLSLLSHIYQGESRMNQNYIDLLKKEECVYQNDFTNLVEKVLH